MLSMILKAVSCITLVVSATYNWMREVTIGFIKVITHKFNLYFIGLVALFVFSVGGWPALAIFLPIYLEILPFQMIQWAIFYSVIGWIYVIYAMVMGSSFEDAIAEVNNSIAMIVSQIDITFNLICDEISNFVGFVLTPVVWVYETIASVFIRKSEEVAV